MMFKKLIRPFAFGCLIALSIAIMAPARASADPASFIQGLGDKAIQILQNSNMSQPARKTAFAQLFRQGFDVQTISRFVLGRYWRSATPQQQSDFTNTFRDYIIAIYSQQFSNYTGETFKITGQQQADPSTTTVVSEIDRPNGGPPIHVNWIVADEKGAYKIVDVSVENLSMRTTQRDEFASVIDRAGGNVQSLIDQLKAKVAQG